MFSSTGTQQSGDIVFLGFHFLVSHQSWQADSASPEPDAVCFLSSLELALEMVLAQSRKINVKFQKLRDDMTSE